MRHMHAGPEKPNSARASATISFGDDTWVSGESGGRASTGSIRTRFNDTSASTKTTASWRAISSAISGASCRTARIATSGREPNSFET